MEMLRPTDNSIKIVPELISTYNALDLLEPAATATVMVGKAREAFYGVIFLFFAIIFTGGLVGGLARSYLETRS